MVRVAHPHSNIIHSSFINTIKKMDGSQSIIRNVWKDNFEVEMEAIRALIHDFPFVSMVP